MQDPRITEIETYGCTKEEARFDEWYERNEGRLLDQYLDTLSNVELDTFRGAYHEAINTQGFLNFVNRKYDERR